MHTSDPITRVSYTLHVSRGMHCAAFCIETLTLHPQLPVDEILFLTDNVKEVDAALEAGMQSVLVIRPGNAVVEESDRLRLRMISSFEELGAVLEKGSNCDDADAVLSAPLENSGAVVASADIEPVEPSPRRSQRVKWKEG